MTQKINLTKWLWPLAQIVSPNLTLKRTVAQSKALRKRDHANGSYSNPLVNLLQNLGEKLREGSSGSPKRLKVCIIHGIVMQIWIIITSKNKGGAPTILKYTIPLPIPIGWERTRHDTNIHWDLPSVKLLVLTYFLRSVACGDPCHGHFELKHVVL